MAVEGYDRHRRDEDSVKLGDQIAHRYPLMWPAVWIARAVKWAVHRTVYGVLGTAPGRVMLFILTAWGLANAVIGAQHGTLQGWLPTLLLVALLYGAHQYRQRRLWEDRVKNIVYHDVPGHDRKEQEVVWFPARGIGSGRNILLRNLGRWTGCWKFAFWVPAAARNADLAELADHLRERLPAAHGSSWMFAWDLRASVASARLVEDMPDTLSRENLAYRLADPESAELDDRDRFPVGVSVDGVEVWDVEEAPHVLATGETGRGKSVAQLGVVCHALDHPADWTILAADPKRVELGYLEGYQNVRVVAKDLEAIVGAIKRAESEMDKRLAKMEAGGVNHIRKLDSSIPRILVVVDELQQVTMPSGAKDPESKEVDEMKLSARGALERIAALGRASGVHLYLSTQRPDVAQGILTGPLKHNLSGRLACGKMDQTASQMALDTTAATNLPDTPKGRAVWRGIEGEKQVQVAFTQESDLPEKNGTGAGW